jgi:hypothetical protein
MSIKGIFMLAVMYMMPLFSIAQKIEITVYNKTGYDIDSVSFQKISFGKILKDSSSYLADIKQIYMLGELPMLRPTGIISGKKRPINLKECGTKSRIVKSGTFAFDICIYEIENEHRLYWRKHQ